MTNQCGQKGQRKEIGDEGTSNKPMVENTRCIPSTNSVLSCLFLFFSIFFFFFFLLGHRLTSFMAVSFRPWKCKTGTKSSERGEALESTAAYAIMNVWLWTRCRGVIRRNKKKGHSIIILTVRRSDYTEVTVLNILSEYKILLKTHSSMPGMAFAWQTLRLQFRHSSQRGARHMVDNIVAQLSISQTFVIPKMSKELRTWVSH